MATGEIRFSEVHTDGIANGETVWYASHNNSTGGAATFSGAVDQAATCTIALNKGNFNFIANPYPVGLQLNNKEQADWSKASGADNYNDADKAWIWNPATSDYEKWFYYDDHGLNPDWTGFWDMATGEITFDSVHPDGLPVGTPLWFYANGTLGEGNTFDVTFKSPLK